jgi:hypothetical protein
MVVRRECYIICVGNPAKTITIKRTLNMVAPFLNDVLSDATLVALSALTGTIFSNVTQRKNARDQEQISILDITVRSLSDRVSTLEGSLAAAERAADLAEDGRRRAEVKWWEAVSFAHTVIDWGRSLKILIPSDKEDSIPTEPQIPESMR